MSRVTDVPEKAKRRARSKTRFPGITEDAKTLGVSRRHLWAVLTGERTSHSLMARYQELKSEGNQDGN